jgi:hypothetical protein
MRIVSQNKRVDINYRERGIFLVDNSLNIDAFDSVADRFYINCTDNDYILGIYITEERALEVMEEIRESYIGDSQRLIVSELTNDNSPLQLIPIQHYFYMPID